MINGGIINTVAAAAEVCTTNNSSFPVANTAYYKLDGDATDSAGTYNGTPSNITWGEGRFGPAAVFNGSNSHIDFPSPIPYTNTDMTFSCWINLASSFSSSYKAIIGAGNKTNGEGRIRLLIRYVSANSYRIEPIRAYSGNSYYTATSNYPPQTIYAGSWYNLVYTYSATGNTAKIYLNGSLVSTTNLTITSTDTDSGVLALGQYRDGGSTSTRWNGSIDQVRIFNTTLTQAQVTELYEDEIECCTTDEVNYPVTNTAYYQLNGGTGTTVTDETGTYNGTAVNGITYGGGKFDDAAVFNGINDYINLGNGLTSGLTNSFTVSLWLKIDTSPSGNTCAFSFQRTIWFDMFVPASNILNVRLLNSGVASSAVSILNPLVNGTWNNVVFVADKTNSIVKLYLNGQLQGSASWNGTKYDRVQKNVIGSYGTATTAWFPGSVDQVRIFDTAITQGQVAELYQEKLCGCTTDTIDYPVANTAYYQLNGNATDSTTNGYNGTFTNPAYAAGKFGQAAVFNGSSSKIVTTLNPNGFSQITLSCWIKTTSTGLNDHIISANDGSSWNFLSMASGIVSFGAGNALSSIFLATHTGAINDGNWHHICGTYNGTNAILYIDGTSYTPASATANLSVNIAFGIGYRNTAGSSGTFYNGSIDQVRIFNKGITAGQVADLYREIQC